MSGAALRARFVRDHAEFEVPSELKRFAQATLTADGDASALRWRSYAPGTGWSGWRRPEVRFSEGRLHLLRVRPPEAATRLALAGGMGLTDLSIEFQAAPSPESRLWRDRPLEVAAPAVAAAQGEPGRGSGASASVPGSSMLAVRQDALVPPPPFVVDRVAWGARQPDQLCNGVRPVYRFTIHHTASPADNGDMPARMRRIQAYHMDSQRWCDIGYHFVVGSDGTVYQGRNDERRPAAHAGGQNDGNIGMSLIGNFDEGPVPAAQFAGAARLLRWALDTHGIEPNRDAVRGHQQWPGNNTACPGEHLFPRLDELLGAALALGPGGAAPGQPDPEEPDPEEPDPEEPEPAEPEPAEPEPAEPEPAEPEPAEPEPAEPEPAEPEAPDGGMGDEVSAGRGPDGETPWTLRWVERPVDLHRQGQGRGVPDLRLGERTEVEWLVRGEGAGPVSGLQVAFAPGPALAVLTARLESDAPTGDRRTWTAFASALTATDLAALNLPPVQPGTSVRLVVSLEAVEVVRASRLAVRLVGEDGAGANGEAEAAGGAGSTLGVLPHTVLAVDAWRFPPGDAADVAGWARCDDGPGLAHDGAGLGLTAGRCAASPAWTEIDTTRWSGLAFALTAAQAGTLRLWFAAPGAEFDPRHRAVVALVAGENAFGLELGDRVGWTGAVGRLALYADADLVLTRVAAQSRDEAADGAPRLAWREILPSAPEGGPPGGGLGAPLDDPGGLGPDEADLPDPGSGGAAPASAASGHEDGGCAQRGTPARPPGGPLALAVLGSVVWGTRRRRHRERSPPQRP